MFIGISNNLGDSNAAHMSVHKCPCACSVSLILIWIGITSAYELWPRLYMNLILLFFNKMVQSLLDIIFYIYIVESHGKVKCATNFAF